MKFKCLDEVIIKSGCGHDDGYIGHRAILIQEYSPEYEENKFTIVGYDGDSNRYWACGNWDTNCFEYIRSNTILGIIDESNSNDLYRAALYWLETNYQTQYIKLKKKSIFKIVK